MRAIERAAQRYGSTRYEVAELMTLFLEAIADEVALGNVVSIPGFGAFGPWLIETRSAMARDSSWRCKPVFSPARPFSDLVRLSAPANRKGKRKISRHRRNHHASSKPDRESVGVITTMEAIRESIRKQLGD